MTRIVFSSIAIAIILGFAGVSLAQTEVPPNVEQKTEKKGSSKDDRLTERAKKRAEKRAERRELQRKTRAERRAGKRAERRANRKARLGECRQRAKSSKLRGFDRRAFLRQCSRRG